MLVIRRFPETKNILRYISKKYVDSATAAPTTTTTASTNSVILSDSCKKHLNKICENGSFLRVTVEGGGCSGFQYKFDLDNKLSDDDVCFGDESAKVVVDTTSLEYCAGSTIDYHSELIRAGFRIVGNPKAEQGCSCGSSFAIRLD